MEKSYAVRIRPDGTVDKVETKGDWEEYQRLVDGFFEVVWIRLPGRVMLVDEEGKLKGKPYNPLATLLYSSCSGIFDFIVGDAILLKLERVGEYQELDSVPMTEEEADELMDWFHYVILREENEERK